MFTDAARDQMLDYGAGPTAITKSTAQLCRCKWRDKYGFYSESKASGLCTRWRLDRIPRGERRMVEQTTNIPL